MSKLGYIWRLLSLFFPHLIIGFLLMDIGRNMFYMSFLVAKLLNNSLCQWVLLQSVNPYRYRWNWIFSAVIEVKQLFFLVNRPLTKELLYKDLLGLSVCRSCYKDIFIYMSLSYIFYLFYPLTWYNLILCLVTRE